ncbi:hypothetical protein PIB30_101194 [Stylosanthes scabra]|uniref:Uncharacterized protein n=1 Tax=Stylosanthes scabra TaxID=79078 RepID=A0ABU6SXN8_9FABA|nr:hypothetical protein [Stylosanthes scabra]
MGCQASMFEIRRCAFGDKPYGVTESYSREEVDVEVNSPGSLEIGLWDSRSNDSLLLVGHSFAALFLNSLGPRGWSVTLPPLGSLRFLGQACELWTLFDVFRVVPSIFQLLDACKEGSDFICSGCYVSL